MSAPTDHAAKPVMGEDEDYVDYLGRCAEYWMASPPAAPEGFELIKCTAEPRHWPLYAVTDTDFYDGPCMYCCYDDISKYPHLYRHLTEHHSRRWLKLVRRLRRVGLIRGYAVSFGSPAGCRGCISHVTWRWS